MINARLSVFDFHTKMFVIILAALMPLILFLTQGYLPSISAYWETPMQPLFIITNASTSYHLYGIKSWRLSAFLLLLLTAFSVTDYGMIHNIVAVLFFISCLFPLYTTNHYKFVFWVYLAAMPIMIGSMFVGESIAVIAMCLYHALVLIRVKRLFDI